MRWGQSAQLDELRETSLVRAALRGVLLVTPLVATTGLLLGGWEVAGFWWIVIALLSLWAAVLPDSDVPTAVLLTVVAAWLVTGSTDLHLDRPGQAAGLLVAAVSLVTAHTAAALAASGPDAARITRPQLIRWGLRYAVLLGVTVLVWGLGVLLAGARQTLPLVLFLVALALVAGGVVVLSAVVQGTVGDVTLRRRRRR